MEPQHFAQESCYFTKTVVLKGLINTIMNNANLKKTFCDTRNSVVPPTTVEATPFIAHSVFITQRLERGKTQTYSR